MFALAYIFLLISELIWMNSISIEHIYGFNRCWTHGLKDHWCKNRCFIALDVVFAYINWIQINIIYDQLEVLGNSWREIHHYNDVMMSTIASQITSLTIAYSTVYSGADQRKHQRFASLAFVQGIHRGPVNSPHKGPLTRKMFPFNDVIMRWKMTTKSTYQYHALVNYRSSESI